LGWRLVSKHGLFSGSMLIWRRVFCSWWWFEAYIYEILRDLCAFFVTFWVHLTKLLDVFRGLKLATSFWVYRFPTCSNCADLTIIAKCPQGPRACLSSEFLKVGMLQKKSAPTISVFFTARHPKPSCSCGFFPHGSGLRGFSWGEKDDGCGQRSSRSLCREGPKLLKHIPIVSYRKLVVLVGNHSTTSHSGLDTLW
jgi:hypothetical protein